MLDRNNSPGAGAISYHGRQFETTRDIEAGEELFDGRSLHHDCVYIHSNPYGNHLTNSFYSDIDYGDHWLDHRPGTYADYVPREKDYRMASAALARLNRGRNAFVILHLYPLPLHCVHHPLAHLCSSQLTFITITANRKCTSIQRIHCYHVSFQNLKISLLLLFETVTDKELSMVAKTISVFSERAASIFPDTAAKHKDFIQKTNQMIKNYNRTHISQKELPFYLAQSNLVRRDVDWIQTHGICIENIRPGQSNLPHAGRGAFAQLSIPKGDIIVPAPLLTIPNQDSLRMYPTKINEEGDRVKIDDTPIGHQLLMNYCFGHTQSKLLLCPQTNAILINHCSTRHKEGRTHTCNHGNGPNARVQWASGWDPNTKDWLQKSMEEIRELTANGQRGLSLEIVATTDIGIGEEVRLVVVVVRLSIENTWYWNTILF